MTHAGRSALWQSALLGDVPLGVANGRRWRAAPPRRDTDCPASADRRLIWRSAGRSGGGRLKTCLAQAPGLEVFRGRLPCMGMRRGRTAGTIG